MACVQNRSMYTPGKDGDRRLERRIGWRLHGKHVESSLHRGGTRAHFGCGTG